MVDVLRRIHSALVPGGMIVDTQPVGERWPVVLDADPLGELDTEEWLETIAAVDAETEKTIAAGLYEPRHEECSWVVHEFGSGEECLEEVATWAGTRISDAVAGRLQGSSERATVEHEVRLRLLRRR